ncbi:hypothetical protein BRE01_19920 [Brevibacillus reuszeri]|uniref:Uncharacterized protein n=1 Tax=Brevibacillus reuszeri TaxID=54915 RepID=A0ABQ0TK52_9BACL|nr:hypothetical protein BRE01_19920 [Brevibacillus reuszeri]
MHDVVIVVGHEKDHLLTCMISKEGQVMHGWTNQENSNLKENKTVMTIIYRKEHAGSLSGMFL